MGMVIMNPGIYTTVQDEGRFGYEQFGVSPAGPMDKRAFHLANLLVGNEISEAELEMTFSGPAIRFTGPAVIALTGADMQPLLNGVPICTYRAVPVRRGDVLLLQHAARGCRSYLAVAGGMEISVIMGSRSTLVKNRIGGLEGRPLKRGDVIEFRAETDRFDNSAARLLPVEGKSEGCCQVRVIPGPQEDRFTEDGIKNFYGSIYKVTGDSDRMGYRLEGPPPGHITDGNIISDGIVMGSIQVTTAGQPIVMMADSQSIGGYTKIASVISVDLPLIGQCRAGDELRFIPVEIEEAHRLYRDYCLELKKLESVFSAPVQYQAPEYFQVKVKDREFAVKVEEQIQEEEN
ncbi:biotin-dependent carboxyltransferase family protein [Lachnospiraceae bacterium 54-53]